MKIIKNITEDEMISVFLKGEITSDRFSSPILYKLDKDNKSRNIIDTPNINNIQDNEYRRKVLNHCRGYSDSMLFEGFPDNVDWKRISLSKEELGNIKYINYSYWNELSEGTRLVKIGAQNVLNGKVVFGKSNESFFNVLEGLKNGQKFSEIILVAKDEDSKMVVLEGHLRSTSFCMGFEYLPDTIEVLVGYSSEMDKWNLY